MSVKRGKCQIIKACNLSGKKTKTVKAENISSDPKCFHIKTRHSIIAFSLILYSKLFHGSDIFLISLFFFQSFSI